MLLDGAERQPEVVSRAGNLEIHLGVEENFRAQQRAPPGILVDDLDALANRLEFLSPCREGSGTRHHFLIGNSSSRSGRRHHKTMASSTPIWIIGETVSRSRLAVNSSTGPTSTALPGT